ncbi:MAG: hypothetical protein IH853_05835 [Bacteroidetes bacterium]|nr:hypothetical protein [Bacteroidota bacterium]
MTSPVQHTRSRRYERLNEIHFIERDEFVQMGPAIVQLEISRLGDMLHDIEPGSDIHTTLVTVRHHLSLFHDELNRDVEVASFEHLDAAIVCLSFPDSETTETTRDTMVYVADRLGYILAQMKRLR